MNRYREKIAWIKLPDINTISKNINGSFPILTKSDIEMTFSFCLVRRSIIRMDKGNEIEFRRNINFKILSIVCINLNHSIKIFKISRIK